jgi:predicted ATPase with chaperone activity
VVIYLIQPVPVAVRRVVPKTICPAYLDRFDILLDVAELRPSELLSDQLSESTADVRMRILSSRKFAAARQADQLEILNAHLEAKSLNEELKNNEEIRTLYSEALEKKPYLHAAFINQQG